MKIGALILYLIVNTTLCIAQELFTGRHYFDSETTYGVTLHSNGWGGSLRKGFKKGGVKTTLLEADLVRMKSPKEVKYFNPSYPDAKGYYFGKLNNLSVLRTGIGIMDIMYIKAKRDNGVEINYHFTGGLSTAFLKPIYLYIINYSNSQVILSEEKYDPDKHFPEKIFGRAPVFKGLTEMTIKPGIYLKSGMGFDYSNFPDEIRKLEAGFVLDYFFGDLPVMAKITNKNLFLSFYVNFQIGYKK